MYRQKVSYQSPDFDMRRDDLIVAEATKRYRSLMDEVLRDARKIEEALTELPNDKLVEAARLANPSTEIKDWRDAYSIVCEAGDDTLLASVNVQAIKNIVEKYWDEKVMDRALEEAEAWLDRPKESEE